MRKNAFNWLSLFCLLFGAVMISSCDDDPVIDSEPEDPGIPWTPLEPAEPILDPVPMAFQEKTYGATLTVNEDGSYTIVTTSTDPIVFTVPFEEDLHEKYTVLEFDYKATAEINLLQMFFCHDNGKLNISHSGNYGPMPAKSDWTHHQLMLKRECKEFEWGDATDGLRIDFGERSDITLDVRNLQMRVMTPEEEKKYDEDFANSNYGYEELVKNYLSAEYQSKVSNVKVAADKVTISGNYSGSGEYRLVEIPPYVDLIKLNDVESQFNIALKSSNFEETVDRFVTKDGYTYDRLLSRWVIYKKGEAADEMVSHARYANPDDIAVKQSIPEIVPAGKKGLGGISLHGGNLLQHDFDELDITSGTINIFAMQFMHATQQPGDIVHSYNGKDYYFSEAVLQSMLDAPLQEAANRNIVVAGILLIHPVGFPGTDEGVTRILQHPDYQPVGAYTMPNMTTLESTDCYAALIDFLAQRYSKAQGPRIAHWIIHNEVDGGINWTNMGNDVLPATYMDTYIRSLRMCYNIIHQYDQNSRVLPSFSHSWTSISNPGWHKVKDQLDMLNQYSAAEGDFYWAPACHSYPTGLTDPKVWKDWGATFSMDSQYATLKNLEILDKWVKMPANQYKGNIKRLIWLSECGTGTKVDCSQQDLEYQAAGFAYAWKKIKALDGIEGIQWHNWFDNRAEYCWLGLRDEQGNPKPVYEVYKNAGTANEDAYFEQFLPVIGITDWNILQEIPD